MKLQAEQKKILADTLTPVSVYLRVRDQFPNSCLLESSDYHGQENSYSFIAFDPIASFSVHNDEIIIERSGEEQKEAVTDVKQVLPALKSFVSSFEISNEPKDKLGAGLFGFTGYDAVRFFESVEIDTTKSADKIPDLHYFFYRYVIAINHFNNEAHIIGYKAEGEQLDLNRIADLINAPNHGTYHFDLDGAMTSNLTDEQFGELVGAAKKHCQRGDVFQLVLSRKFEQAFTGDDFNVYRALRSVNPSPYLFYFDFGDYRIFGSSPESQLVVQNGRAAINPIAGTFKRTGHDEEDAQKALLLKEDKKENAEHTMLVDLARNDLSRFGTNVTIDRLKEVQFYSHVIHLVSQVSGDLKPDADTLDVVASTFPAGTLSGAPKVKAMELIERYEQDNRQQYGGCIGFLDFKGNFNHAIIIRSFLSKNNKLAYQAGAGIVSDSTEISETNEVYNKLGALNKALALAQELN
jgi:anthranilate synthase component 1